MPLEAMLRRLHGAGGVRPHEAGLAIGHYIIYVFTAPP